jgi:carbamoyl-phosphate synthase large subunit
VSVSNDHPVLVDQYLVGTECEVDAITDGKTVVIPGVMEHIERAGVHSGDSMAVYPPQDFSADVIHQIETYTIELANALHCIGIMNIQFIVQDGQVYVIEVNPRASRTVPFLSKVTGISMAQVATQAILGKDLAALGFTTGILPVQPGVHVKAPVFSFSKLNAVDSLLGPEMKSTGEVMGSDTTLEKALYKAFEASHTHLPSFGTALFTVADHDKQEAVALAKRFREVGYQIVATSGTAKALEAAGVKVTTISKLGESGQDAILDAIADQKLQLVINTTSDDRTTASDGYRIRQTAIMHGVPLMTSLDTAAAIASVLESRAFTTQAL